MKVQWKKLLLCLALPLAVGGLAALLIKDSMAIFKFLNKPPLVSPEWAFPLAWTILYVLMGIASYLVLVSDKPKRGALILYLVQLAFNFFWPIFFFNLEAYLVSFIWLVVLWLLILLTALRFFTVSKAAGWLMLPYLLWVTFAGYLNLGIYLLN